MMSNLCHGAFAVILSLSILTGCRSDAEQPVPTPGSEVRFMANVSDSRTFYGDETIDTDGTPVCPIYWSHGDHVAVASAGCVSDSGNHAVYQIGVNADEESGDYSQTQDYASTFDAVTPGGLRWGDDAEAAFFSVYPHKPEHSYKAAGRSIEASLFINPVQQVDFEKRGDVWTGAEFAVTAEGKRIHNPDALMYAQSRATTADAGVRLTYMPFSTVMRIEIAGYEMADGVTAEDGDTLFIDEIMLEAPEGTPLAGSFSAAFDGDCVGKPSVAVGEGTSNTVRCILSSSGGRRKLTVGAGDKLAFNIFVIPCSSMTVDGSWTIFARTSAGDFVKKLDTGSGEIAPSLIHPVKLPKFTVSETFTPDYTHFLASLPDDTPLARVSLPGAWRVHDADYQPAADCGSLFGIGIRAFHIDMRLTAKSQTDNKPVLSKQQLCCTGSETFTSRKLSNWTGVSAKVKEIADALPADEFALCFMTISDVCYQNNTGSINYGTLRQDLIFEALTTELRDAGIRNLYEGPVNGSTEIGTLRGKVALIFLTENSTSFLDYDDAIIPPATLIPVDMRDGGFSETTPYYGKTQCGDSRVKYHVVERTNNSAGPTMNDRMLATNAMCEFSRDIFASGSTDGLIVFSMAGSLYNNSTYSVPLFLNANKMPLRLETLKAVTPLGVIFLDRVLYTPSFNVVKRLLRINASLR